MNKVRLVFRGYLYINIDKDQVIKIKNPYDYVPQSVTLVKKSGAYYIKGFEPMEEKRKTEYKKVRGNNVDEKD